MRRPWPETTSWPMPTTWPAQTPWPTPMSWPAPTPWPASAPMPAPIPMPTAGASAVAGAGGVAHRVPGDHVLRRRRGPTTNRSPTTVDDRPTTDDDRAAWVSGLSTRRQASGLWISTMSLLVGRLCLRRGALRPLAMYLDGLAEDSSVNDDLRWCATIVRHGSGIILKRLRQTWRMGFHSGV